VIKVTFVGASGAAPLDPNTAATLSTAETVAMRDELFTAHRDLLPAAFTR
jgi:hypothetical protein